MQRILIALSSLCLLIGCWSKPDVLEAFELVQEGIDKENVQTRKANADVISQLEILYKAHPIELDECLRDAKYAKLWVSQFVAYVETLRKLVNHVSGGYEDRDSTILRGKRNYDVPTHLLVDQGRGADLKREIEILKDSLLSLSSLDSIDKVQLSGQIILSTSYNMEQAKRLGKKSWEAYYFDHVPVVAVNTLLMKFEGDAYHSGTSVLERLLEKAETAIAEEQVKNTEAL